MPERILYQAKLSFTMEGETKIFHDKTIFKQYLFFLHMGIMGIVWMMRMVRVATFMHWGFIFFSLTWVFLIYISNVIPFPSFWANIPLILPPPLPYGCSPPHPPPIAALHPTIMFTADSVLAGPRASPSTGALTRIFIATYEVIVQGQSMYSL